MTRTSDELLAFIRDIGIDAPTTEHPHVKTIAESRTVRGHIAGVHTKNLFLRDAKRRYFLVVTDEETKIDLKALSTTIGASGKLSFGSADSLMEILGVESGCVSLLALANDRERKVTLVLDDELRTASVVNCHPLASNRTTSLSTDDISRFVAATEHRPLYVRL
jgi:Ala-tRNA(Pro) deacylase